MAGHVARRPDDWLPKTMPFAHNEGTSPKGGRRKPWTIDVRDDLVAQSLSYSWYRKVQDRAG